MDKTKFSSNEKKKESKCSTMEMIETEEAEGNDNFYFDLTKISKFYNKIEKKIGIELRKRVASMIE